MMHVACHWWKPQSYQRPLCLGFAVVEAVASSSNLGRLSSTCRRKLNGGDHINPDLEKAIPASSAADAKIVSKDEVLIPWKGPPPEAPVTCCMSGCANCVYLKYAAELLDYCADGGEKALEAVKRDVNDDNMKAFLLLEVRNHLKNLTKTE